jgi:prepilin-type N-terminal cleavage/methylation domain-containing protein
MTISGACRVRSRGFTLLEVVLAMTALALVTGICYAAFHLGVRAVERGEVAVVTAQRLRVASDTIIRQVKSTVAYAARNKDEDVYPYFVGTATSMTFITAAGLTGGGGLTRVIYQVANDPTRLILSESPFFSPDALGTEPPDNPGQQSAILLDGFKNLKFEYLMNDGVDTEWRPDWDGHDEEELPAAVRITVEGMAGLEVPVWGQEMPIMVALYGDNLGEVDEEDLAEQAAESADDDDGTNSAVNGGNGGQGSGGDDGDDGDDDTGD